MSIRPQKATQVAIVGRANVGKSMLFNRLIERDKAIVSPIAGTTRDRNIDTVRWRGRIFTLVDTGGLDIQSKGATVIEQGIVTQAEKAINKAQIILFVIDVKAGVLPDDKKLAKSLLSRNLKSKIILVGNKADSIAWHQPSPEMYRLGLGVPSMTSAASGAGSGDLLDEMIERFSLTKNEKDEIVEEQSAIKLAIVGKPNVGKSSLMNAILGEERVIVSDIPYTTRESHDEYFFYHDQPFILVDTAGLRRNSRVKPRSLEQASVRQTEMAVKRADVVMLITDSSLRLDVQDKKISQLILDSGKPLLLIANKWDKIPDKDTNTVNKFKDYYDGQFPYLWWSPLVFVSAHEGLRAHKLLDQVIAIHQAGAKKISDKQLELFLKKKIKQHRPSRGMGLKNPYIYTIEQTGIYPPRFKIEVNDPKIIHFSYLRFLQNGLREQFGLIGTPIQIETIKHSVKLKIEHHINKNPTKQHKRAKHAKHSKR